MPESFFVKRIAVLGAGVMGAQIAAHCVNAGIETLLYDLKSKEGNPNELANKAIEHLKKMKPAPLALPELVSHIKAQNYDQDLALLSNCDLIIEAIAERLDWKKALYEQITPHLNNETVLVSNTSGLSIHDLASSLPERYRKRFCGVHFFNPPRYMHLAELIPTENTAPKLLEALETWLTSYLGKGVVRAKDTPNFIANRVGVFSLLSIMHRAETMKLGLDEVDALTGVLIGRPKSATFRTMDVVGLDTMAHVVHTMQQLSDDPWHPFFTLPHWFQSLIDKGYIGQKSGQGLYRKKGKLIEVYDLEQDDYRPVNVKISDETVKLLSIKNPKERFKALLDSNDKQARFLSACLMDLYHYCAFHLEEIAHTVRDVDLAIRWGFGWNQGPFETWQSTGFFFIKEQLDEWIKVGKTLSHAHLPEWLAVIDAFYEDAAAYSVQDREYIGRSHLDVYKRQFFPDGILTERSYPTTTLYENEGVRLFHLKDDVAVACFKSKANTIGQAVLDGLQESLFQSEKQCRGLILFQEDANNFSSGADLRGVQALIQSNDFSALEAMIKQFQSLAMRLKYSSIPVVAALRGRALGGGCELIMHCNAITAGFESYPGLVEAGVGLIPAGGGCKEMALRAALAAGDADLMNFIQPYFERIATAAIAGNATEAFKWGYLQASDSWVMHKNEVLFAALAKVNELIAMNHVPPLAPRFKVAGREGHARLQVGLVNWLEGGFITQYDYALTNKLAFVLCGGDLNEGDKVDEEWILKLERETFLELAQTKETQERINHLLETGKPLRN